MHNELLDLFATRAVLWRIIRILSRRRGKKHPLMLYGGVVYGAIRLAYATYGALAVRRMVDSKPGARSLMRLLMAVQGRPSEITRSWFVSQWDPSLHHLAERAFNRLAGKGRPYLTRKIVLNDQQRLRDRTKKIVDWANAYVAHRGAHPPAPATFRDLRLAINAVMRINNKYAELLIEREAMKPVILEPWESVFYVPWLRGSRRRR